jgi:hypothetical protein
MIIEYILVGVIAFSIGHRSGKHKCKHKEQIVVVHKHKKHKFRKKFRHTPLLRKRHIHKHHTINMMCRNNWKF